MELKLHEDFWSVLLKNFDSLNMPELQLVEPK